MLRAARAEAAGSPSRADHAAVARHPVLDDPDVTPVSIPPAASARPEEDMTCDLTPEARDKLDAALAVPEGRTHYAVLGVVPGASTKEISRAYFAADATFHPDRYFGKRLGPYKKKLEHAFRTASDAYDVLRSPARRAEYDGYMGLRRKSVEMDAALAPASAPPPASPASGPPPVWVPAAPRLPVAAPIPASVPVSVRAPGTAPPPPGAGLRPGSAPPTTFTASRPSSRPLPPLTSVVATPPAIASNPPPPPETRVSATLPPASRSGPPSARVSQSPIRLGNIDSPPTNGRPQSSGRSIVAAAKSASLLDQAQQALLQGDAISAANLYRLALQYAEEPTARARAEAGLSEARSMLADTYLKTARYEEKEGRWPEAVASYARALDRRPDDPTICERLANALRQEGQDLLRATRLAELATSRLPRDAGCRRTLALIYADSGLREKAIEQLQKACEIDPSDEATKRALTGLRRKSR
jgi:tetratricopeptide (TPR) repeat protein